MRNRDEGLGQVAQRMRGDGRPSSNSPLGLNTQAEGGSSSDHHTYTTHTHSHLTLSRKEKNPQNNKHFNMTAVMYLEGIRAINSSPEGQSFSLYTIASPSLDLGRSEVEKEI